jgi:hypothetical protein
MQRPLVSIVNGERSTRKNGDPRLRPVLDSRLDKITRLAMPLQKTLPVMVVFLRMACLPVAAHLGRPHWLRMGVFWENLGKRNEEANF